MIELLGHVTYKPGWRIELENSGWGLGIGVEIETQDSNHPGADKVVIHFNHPLPPWLIDAIEKEPPAKVFSALLNEVQLAIKEAELHEAAEWLRFDGVPVVDPHPYGISGTPGRL